MNYANGRLQLPLAGFDLQSLSDREMCSAVFLALVADSLTLSLTSQESAKLSVVVQAVLIDGHPMTDLGRSFCKAYMSRKLCALFDRQQVDERIEQTNRRLAETRPTGRPDIGIYLATAVEPPATNE